MTQSLPSPSLSSQADGPAGAFTARDPSAIQPVGGVELASFLAARMCHDYISPAGAIVSGLDLLEDPSAEDMREEALTMIAASAKKLVAALSFDRVAFGASASAESFDVRLLETLVSDLFVHARAELEWAVEPPSLAKPAARVLLNLAQIGVGALPVGGVARLSARTDAGRMVVAVRAAGARLRVRPEVLTGLAGEALGEGLGGHWVQAYYLRQIVDAFGGTLEVQVGEGEASVTVCLAIDES